MKTYIYFLVAIIMTTVHIASSQTTYQLSLTNRNLETPGKTKAIEQELDNINISLKAIQEGCQALHTSHPFCPRAGNHTCEIQASMLLHEPIPTTTEIDELAKQATHETSAFQKLTQEEKAKISKNSVMHFLKEKGLLLAKPIADHLKTIGLCYILSPESLITIPASLKKSYQKELQNRSQQYIQAIAHKQQFFAKQAPAIHNNEFARVYLILKHALTSKKHIGILRKEYCATCYGTQDQHLEFYANQQNTFAPCAQPTEHVLFFEGIQFPGTLKTLQEKLNVTQSDGVSGILQQYDQACRCSTKQRIKYSTPSLPIHDQLLANSAALCKSDASFDEEFTNKHQEYQSVEGYSPQNASCFCVTRCFLHNPKLQTKENQK